MSRRPVILPSKRTWQITDKGRADLETMHRPIDDDGNLAWVSLPPRIPPLADAFRDARPLSHQEPRRGNANEDDGEYFRDVLHLRLQCPRAAQKAAAGGPVGRRLSSPRHVPHRGSSGASTEYDVRVNFAFPPRP